MASNVARLTLLANNDAVERTLPMAAPVDRVGFTLDRVHRGGDRCPDGGPGAHLGVVGGAPDLRIDGCREPSHRRHRHLLAVSVGKVDIGGELRRDVALQPAPRRRAGRGELGVEALFRLGHLVCRPLVEAFEGSAMLGDLAADRCQLIDAERMHPIREPSEEWRNVGLVGIEPARQRLGELVARIGGDRRVDDGSDLAEIGAERVVGSDHLIGCLSIGCGDGSRRDRPHIVLIEQRDQSPGGRADSFHTVGETAGIETFVNVGHTPARQRLGFGDAHDAPREMVAVVSDENARRRLWTANPRPS